MLGGRYFDDATRKMYNEKELFASYLQIPLGVALDLYDQPGLPSGLMTARPAIKAICKHHRVLFEVHSEPVLADDPVAV
jgi:hypothetical protein